MTTPRSSSDVVSASSSSIFATGGLLAEQATATSGVVALTGTGTGTGADATPEQHGASALTSHDVQVSARLLQLKAINPAPEQVALPVVMTDSLAAAKTAAQTWEKRADLTFDVSFAPLVGLIGGIAFTNVWLMAGGMSLTLLGMLVSMVLGLRGDSYMKQYRLLVEEQAVTAPGSVAASYRRVMSAAAEIESGEHGRDIVASARLAAEGAHDLMRNIGDHYHAGTLHAAPGQALCAEMLRLAAEMDSYLTAFNAERFAPGEDTALSALSATSTLSFSPDLDSPEPSES